MNWAVYLPLLCLILYFLLAQCWLSLLDYLTCMSSQDEGNIDWNALMAIMLVCLPHHECSVSVIQELSPHVLITSAKQEQCLLEFIEKLGKLSNLNNYFKWSAQLISCSIVIFEFLSNQCLIFASISELNPEYKPEIVMFPNANFGKYLHTALFDYVSKFRGKCYFENFCRMFILHIFTCIESGWRCQQMLWSV